MSLEFFKLQLDNGDNLVIFSKGGDRRSVLESVIEEVKQETYESFNWEEYPWHLRDAIACFDGYYVDGKLYEFRETRPYATYEGEVKIEETIEIPPSDTGTVKITVDYLKESCWL